MEHKNHIVIVTGPQECGKTAHAEALRNHFNMEHICDEIQSLAGLEQLSPGTLALSNLGTGKLCALIGTSSLQKRLWHSVKGRIQVIDFDSAMEEIKGKPVKTLAELADRLAVFDDTKDVAAQLAYISADAIAGEPLNREMSHWLREAEANLLGLHGLLEDTFQSISDLNDEPQPTPIPAQPLEWSHTLLDGDTVTYEEAEKAIAELGDSWRMPTVDELASLVDRSRHEPAIDTEKFPDTKSCCYWTSSQTAWNDAAVWVVNFYGGLVGYSPPLQRRVRSCGAFRSVIF